MRALKRLLIHVAVSALWPSYVLILSYAARVSPWPRSLARPSAEALGWLALALFVGALARFLLGPGGWAEEVVRWPTAAGRQARNAAWSLIGAALLLLLPERLLQRGLIAAGDRAVFAPAISRALVLGFEVVVWAVGWRLVRPASPVMQWLTQGVEHRPWIVRHRRLSAWLVLGFIGGVIALDVQGYSFTARRLATAGLQSALLIAACCGLYMLIVRAIDQHAWRWIRHGFHATGTSAPGALEHPDDLAGRLRRLAAWVVPILGLIVGAWVWNIDLALFRSVGGQPIWPHAPNGVNVGDVTKAAIILLITAALWRHLGAFFAVAVFPRMPDEPGVRFAVLTLCRYVVLGLGLLAGLSAVHLGLEKIGVVLAALGVGLGFGLQEIVSNFVSGIILLLERPIRVGDIVTVSETSGKVDRINIRATTIINWDNKSMIIPNREFITGKLVNWTHKDKIIRIPIQVGVAYGSDPDAVSDLLLAIAREDPDVLRNPLPAATMESFGDSTLNFGLYVFVPDPSLFGRVRHRLCAQIQRRFAEAGIDIPFPMRELHIRTIPPVISTHSARGRIDPASPTPPAPHPACPVCFPRPAEPSHRGVDE